MEYKYDVALSFAGENRIYVEQVADILAKSGLTVFYDRFEEVNLWGKDLSTHFHDVYSKQAKYFIPFISKAYKEKIYTRLEFKTALSRAIESNDEYILPVRFDNTELEGLRSTISYIELNALTPEEFAKKVIEKVKPVTSSKDKIENNLVKLEFRFAVNMSTQKIDINLKMINHIREVRYLSSPSFSFEYPYKRSVIEPGMSFVGGKWNGPFKLEFGQVAYLSYDGSSIAGNSSRYIDKGVQIFANSESSLGEPFKSNPIEFDELYRAYMTTPLYAEFKK